MPGAASEAPGPLRDQHLEPGDRTSGARKAKGHLRITGLAKGGSWPLVAVEPGPGLGNLCRGSGRNTDAGAEAAQVLGQGLGTGQRQQGSDGCRQRGPEPAKIKKLKARLSLPKPA